MSSLMTLAVALKLNDMLSGPLRGAIGTVTQFHGALERVVGPAQRLGQHLKAVGQNLTLFAGALEMVTGAGIKSYVENAIAVEHRLRALGNTAGLSAEQLGGIDRRLSEIARATNQFKADLLTANETLMAAGMEWRTALDLTPILGKTATASQAAMDDLARIAVRAQQNMAVPIAQMQDLFDRLTVAGESGMFELKNMAQYLPALTASMGALKFTGLANIDRLGAALQIAFMGAGEPGVAANNLQNFLDKLAAPVTLKNFEKAGIDLARVLTQARTQGLDPLLVAMEKIQQATKGDEFKIGELFGDQQVLAFIKPMLANLERYRQILGGMGEAAGKSAKNFDNMMTTTQERWKQFVIQLQTTPMPWLDKQIARLSRALDWFNANPEWADRIVTGIAAITATGLGLAVVGPIVTALAAGLGGLVGLMSRAAPAAAALTAAGAAGAGGGKGRLGPLMLPEAPAKQGPSALGAAAGGALTFGAGLAGGLALREVIPETLVAGLDRDISRLMARLGSQAARASLDSTAQREFLASRLATRQALAGGVSFVPGALPGPGSAPGSGPTLGPAVQTLTSAADTTREAAATFGRSADISSQAAGEMDQAGLKQIAAAGAFQAAAQQAATALGTPITGLIRIEVTGPGRVQSVTKTSGTVDLSAGYTGGAMPEAAP